MPAASGGKALRRPPQPLSLPAQPPPAGPSAHAGEGAGLGSHGTPGQQGPPPRALCSLAGPEPAAAPSRSHIRIVPGLGCPRRSLEALRQPHARGHEPRPPPSVLGQPMDDHRLFLQPEANVGLLGLQQTLWEEVGLQDPSSCSGCPAAGSLKGGQVVGGRDLTAPVPPPPSGGSAGGGAETWG